MSIPLYALCPSHWVHYVHPTECIMSIPLSALCPSHWVHYVHPNCVHYVHPTECIMSIPLCALCPSHWVHYVHPIVRIMSMSLCAGYDCEAVRNWEKENLQSTEYNIYHENSAINTRWSVHPVGWQEMYAKNVSPPAYYTLLSDCFVYPLIDLILFAGFFLLMGKHLCYSHKTHLLKVVTTNEVDLLFWQYRKSNSRHLESVPATRKQIVGAPRRHSQYT